MKYNILIIDDDIDILEIITLYLENAGYDIYSAMSCQQALEQLKNIYFDLIILDIMLPGLDGIQLCEKIRDLLYCPILFISSLDEKSNMIKALDAGGDDYITKPFNAKELVARVKANLRRVHYDKCSNKNDSEKKSYKHLILDTRNHLLIHHDQQIYLSPIEFDILMFMIENPNRILTYSEIYENVWNEKSLEDIRTVMVHVSNIRKKISSETQPYIKTIKKVGYKFEIN